jgi:hypothetical protein
MVAPDTAFVVAEHRVHHLVIAFYRLLAANGVALTCGVGGERQKVVTGSPFSFSPIISHALDHDNAFEICKAVAFHQPAGGIDSRIGPCYNASVALFQRLVTANGSIGK